jgi:hypothetical protein
MSYSFLSDIFGPNMNTLVKFKDRHEAFNPLQFKIEDINGSPQVTTYMDHPNIKSSEPRKKCGMASGTGEPTDKPEPDNWDLITQFYLGSITVVGLFIIFRVMQKSK